MTPGDIDVHIDKLTEGANSCVLFSESQADLLKLKLKEQASLISERCDYRMGEVTALLTSYVSYVYLNTNHRIDQVVFHHSPQFFSIIIGIAMAVKEIWAGVMMVIDLLHIVDLIHIADIIAVIWPKFREVRDKFYASISGFSNAIGIGIDGLSHLMNAVKSGVGVLGGVLGKDDDWVEMKGFTKGVTALNTLSEQSVLIQQNPAALFDALTYDSDLEDRTDFWINVKSGLDSIKGVALKVWDMSSKINDFVDDLQSLQNSLPEFIRDHIPQSILDGLTWVDTTIDQTILPAITNINDTLNEVNAVIEAQQKKASELADRLAHPGDVMLSVDQLTETTKKDQEKKIDDVTSRVFEREADEVTRTDSALIKALASIKQLSLLDIPDTEFSGLEDYGRPGILWDAAEKVDGWFVGDF